jgi:hypothetical protein
LVFCAGGCGVACGSGGDLVAVGASVATWVGGAWPW